MSAAKAEAVAPTVRAKAIRVFFIIVLSGWVGVRLERFQDELQCMNCPVTP
jgi:hypothetical protein